MKEQPARRLCVNILYIYIYIYIYMYPSHHLYSWEKSFPLSTQGLSSWNEPAFCSGHRVCWLVEVGGGVVAAVMKCLRLSCRHKWVIPGRTGCLKDSNWLLRRAPEQATPKTDGKQRERLKWPYIWGEMDKHECSGRMGRQPAAWVTVNTHSETCSVTVELRVNHKVWLTHLLSYVLITRSDSHVC